jgi:hypothetical protein
MDGVVLLLVVLVLDNHATLGAAAIHGESGGSRVGTNPPPPSPLLPTEPWPITGCCGGGGVGCCWFSTGGSFSLFVMVHSRFFGGMKLEENWERPAPRVPVICSGVWKSIGQEEVRTPAWFTTTNSNLKRLVGCDPCFGFKPRLEFS